MKRYGMLSHCDVDLTLLMHSVNGSGSCSTIAPIPVKAGDLITITVGPPAPILRAFMVRYEDGELWETEALGVRHAAEKAEKRRKDSAVTSVAKP